MSIKRRQFLILGTLSAGGLGFLVKNLFRAPVPESTKASNTQDIKPVASNKEALLLRFVSVADTGTGTKQQYAVAKAMSHYHQENPFDLVVLAGDNIYNNGEIEKISEVFEQPYKPLLKQDVKFHACLGNHDIRTHNGDPQVRYPGFNMQGRYYTFRRDRVQFFALDTNYNADWKAQLAWLEQELSRSDAPWKVVFGHHQIYSSGYYGLNEHFVKILTPIFKKYGVQLWINGHEHHYERTKPIDGTTYVSCGAGAETRPVRSSEWTAYSASKLSFAAFEVYSDRMVMNGIGTDNGVFDRSIIPIAKI